MKSPSQLVDNFGREITYLRLSVTDRCDFRCQYCMAEDMQFQPRANILSLEELLLVARAFVELGVTKIRLTGGEPLVRNNLPWLVGELKKLPGLEELTMTSNGSRLTQFADTLKTKGLDRINISLDSLDNNRFTEITRTGKLVEVLEGIKACKNAGFANIKINSVILRGINEIEIIDLLNFALKQQLDISFIEEMPLGEVEHFRGNTVMHNTDVRSVIEEQYQLIDSEASTGGPARYCRIDGHDSKIGFISPHSDNFCDSCNRVRVTAEGRLLLCLGNEHSVDLKALVRSNNQQDALPLLKQSILKAMAIKPQRHEFQVDEAPQILRFMNMTGG